MMRHWTHDELHVLMENNSALKAKSDEAHALPQTTQEEKMYSKLIMMEIYAKSINCRRADVAQEFVRKVFLCIRDGMSIDALRQEYVLQRACHSPAGNDYVCFCDEKTE